MGRTGRPRAFDRDEAVRHAMHLFWEFGYEAVSITDLQEIMGGLSAASFYAAFGSKRELFAEAMGLYMETCGAIVAPLEDSEKPPRDALLETMRQAITVQTGHGHPSGCMAVLAGVNLSPRNQEILSLVSSARSLTRGAIMKCIDRAVKLGVLSGSVHRKTLVTMFDTFIKGIAIQARDGLPSSDLFRAAEDLMTVWDSHAENPDAQSSTSKRRSSRVVG